MNQNKLESVEDRLYREGLELKRKKEMLIREKLD